VSICRIEDWQSTSKRYAKETKLTYTFKNRFTGVRVETIPVFGWNSWATDKSRHFMECRKTTMLEF